MADADRMVLTPEDKLEVCERECTVCTGFLVKPTKDFMGPAVWHISNTKTQPFCRKVI